jgi:hypothetical protein
VLLVSVSTLGSNVAPKDTTDPASFSGTSPTHVQTGAEDEGLDLAKQKSRPAFGLIWQPRSAFHFLANQPTSGMQGLFILGRTGPRGLLGTNTQDASRHLPSQDAPRPEAGTEAKPLPSQRNKSCSSSPETPRWTVMRVIVAPPGTGTLWTSTATAPWTHY